MHLTPTHGPHDVGWSSALKSGHRGLQELDLVKDRLYNRDPVMETILRGKGYLLHKKSQ